MRGTLARGAVAAVAVALLACGAQAALITQYEPVYGGGDYVFLDMLLLNDDQGATYDQGTVYTAVSLAHELFVLPINSGTYPSFSHLAGDWTASILAAGDIRDGWLVEGNPPQVKVKDDGGIDLWTYGNDMLLRVFIPITQLDLNSNGVYDPDNGDARVILGAAMDRAFAAAPYQASGFGYSIAPVPEPATIVFLATGLAAAAGVGMRRRILKARA